VELPADCSSKTTLFFLHLIRRIRSTWSKTQRLSVFPHSSKACVLTECAGDGDKAAGDDGERREEEPDEHENGNVEG
ncbi:Os08g0211750, partial [Oryza sativa Japonica Group]